MQRGFTLTELLIALLIAGVMIGIALPAWSSFLASSRAAATLNSFATVLATARSASIRFGTTVRVCPGRDGQCSGRNAWHEGTLAFVDEDADRRVDPEEWLIAVHPGFVQGTLRWRSFRNRTDLVFAPTGLTDWLNGSFLYCPASNDARQARMLIINVAGRMRHAMDRNADGYREDASGKPLAC